MIVQTSDGSTSPTTMGTRLSNLAEDALEKPDMNLEGVFGCVRARIAGERCRVGRDGNDAEGGLERIGVGERAAAEVRAVRGPSRTTRAICGANGRSSA